jgi:uroporphyrinogen decarboxylase
MAEMRSRERVLAAANHQEPDRVPVDIGGGSSTSISVEGYENLKHYLGINSAARTMSKLFRVALLDEVVMKRLGSDCRPLRGGSPVRWRPPPTHPGTTTDIWGVTWKQVFRDDGCYYWDVIRSPLAQADVEDLDGYAWPDVSDPGLTAGLAQEARTLYEGTEYAIEASSGFASFWELATYLRGYEQLLIDLVGNPDFVTALMARLLEINIAGTGRFLAEAGPYIQIFRAADDLATQRGLLMSPRIFRKLLKPFYQKYFDFVKTHTAAKILFHSCGNITDLVEDLIETGMEILNPVQVSAMPDTAALKSRFGGRVVFWGGVDTQHIMPYGTPAEVQHEVRRRISDLGSGGGFVLAAVHSIQPDVPPENILAMADAAQKYGRYPFGAAPAASF